MRAVSLKRPESIITVWNVKFLLVLGSLSADLPFNTIYLLFRKHVCIWDIVSYFKVSVQGSVQGWNKLIDRNSFDNLLIAKVIYQAKTFNIDFLELLKCLLGFLRLLFKKYLDFFLLLSRQNEQFQDVTMDICSIFISVFWHFLDWTIIYRLIHSGYNP